MDDLAGIIIYLIIAVIGILASVYRQKNRHKMVKPPPVPTVPEYAEAEESYETEFDPFAGFFKEKPPVPQQEYVTVEQESKVRELAGEGKAESMEHAEGEAFFKETKETLISDDVQYESPDVFEEIKYSEGTHSLIEELDLTKEHSGPTEEKEEFDLRKAVIHSEILTRRENW
jgi:hypothetical protein